VSPVSSYIHYKSPNVVYRANNVQLDDQLSIQYLRDVQASKYILEIQKSPPTSRVRSTYYPRLKNTPAKGAGDWERLGPAGGVF
jgi:hypothetical protein